MKSREVIYLRGGLTQCCPLCCYVDGPILMPWFPAREPVKVRIMYLPYYARAIFIELL